MVMEVVAGGVLLSGGLRAFGSCRLGDHDDGVVEEPVE
jgi:hypothetical protein